jgi:hypothetical protein
MGDGGDKLIKAIYHSPRVGQIRARANKPGVNKSGFDAITIVFLTRPSAEWPGSTRPWQATDSRYGRQSDLGGELAEVEEGRVGRMSRRPTSDYPCTELCVQGSPARQRDVRGIRCEQANANVGVESENAAQRSNRSGIVPTPLRVPPDIVGPAAA